MYPNTFYRVSLKALIKNRQGQILVLKENQDTWSLPGGGLDHGEEPEAGLLRELKEELGVTSATIKGIAAIKTFYLETKSAWLLWVVYDVEIGDAPFKLGGGVTAAQYIDTGELRDSPDIFEQLVCDVATAP